MQKSLHQWKKNPPRRAEKKLLIGAPREKLQLVSILVIMQSMHNNIEIVQV